MEQICPIRQQRSQPWQSLNRRNERTLHVWPTYCKRIGGGCFVMGSFCCCRSIPSRDAHDAGRNPRQPRSTVIRLGVLPFPRFIRRSSLAILQKRASTSSCCSCPLTPPSRRTRSRPSCGHCRLRRVALWQRQSSNHCDAKLLKTLQPESVYSQPGGDNHFAQADHDAVVVEVSGYGPHYFEAANGRTIQGAQRRNSYSP